MIVELNFKISPCYPGLFLLILLFFFEACSRFISVYLAAHLTCPQVCGQTTAYQIDTPEPSAGEPTGDVRNVRRKPKVFGDEGESVIHRNVSGHRPRLRRNRKNLMSAGRLAPTKGAVPPFLFF